MALILILMGLFATPSPPRRQGNVVRRSLRGSLRGERAGAIIYGTITPVDGAAADIHPLLYYFFLHGWMELGQSPFVVRFPSVVFGLLTLCLVFRIARELFDLRVGLLATALAAISPFHIWYSQEARMYSLLRPLTLLSVYLFIKAREDRKWLHWMGFGVCTGSDPLCHNLAFLGRSPLICSFCCTGDGTS